ncbi:SusC/RagA family TonB-linked outer membrane protein [Niabella beijingensis]|uniref:SusC/RagA family TonB-linked outer membrane protein n=1 Tax=Niabella beijingensis TaxID=2872700 RepID=UPI001CBF193A|nr:SusC/RagA family TonB-linked outer membrane protein [Niabella beijingensis]MBZ4191311.1 SusC/RagA family TonB-linked outer membrane protein [Niabella beijingensis]
MPLKDSSRRLHHRSYWVIILLLLLAPSLLRAQPKQIQGTVTDANNAPVPNASVVNKTSGAGTATNAEGRFRLSASPDDVLEISAVNYETTTVTAGSQTPLAVKLNASTASLADVVVVGYGSRSRRDVGGAVLSVDQRVLKDRPVTNTLGALQGAAPGLVITRSNGQPGREGWTAQIRGITSLGGQNAPLVIIDGIEGDLNALNPNDIQSISVLEDAASASIYGAKAGGGVILVTTKGGRLNQKAKVDLNMMYTWRKPYARPELISSRKQAELQNIAKLNGNQNRDFTDEQLGWFDDPNINDVWNTNTNAWDFYYDYNLEDLLMRKQSPQRNINLTASGGGDKSTYLFSIGYLDQQGVFKFGPDKYDKFNARINYNTKLSNVFSLDTRLSLTKENIDAPSLGITGDGGLMYQVYSIRASRNPIFTPGTNETKYMSIGTISTAYPILKDGGYDMEDRYNVNGVFSLSAKQILKGLDLKAVYSPGLVLSDRVRFNKTIPRWSIDQNMVPIAGTPINQVNSYQKSRPYTIDQSFYTTADYEYKINDHNFHLLAGYEFKSHQFDWLQAIQRALMLNDFPTLNYTSLANADIGNVGDSIPGNAWLSYFGRLSYNFNNKYYFEGTVRRDGSSRLSPGHKFQTFYAGNVFWRAAEEEWFKNALPWINELKLGVSYGTTGGAQTANPNDNNYDFQSFLTLGYYPFNDSRSAYFYQNYLPAEGKAWEVIQTANVGIDLEVLKRRLRIHYDYFIKTNNNVFVDQQLPALLGVIPNAANLAAIKVKGWGVSVNWSDQFRNGSYFISANLSDDKNKVTRYDGSIAYVAGINKSLLGMPTNSIFGYKADGYFDNDQELTGYPVRTPGTGVGDIKLIDVNGDGKINTGNNTAADHGDLTYLGNTNSRYVFGFNAGVNWKGFDLSILFNGVGKRSILLDPYATMAYYDGWRMPWAIHQDYWTPENPNAKFPKLRFGDRINDQISSHWVQDASYIRLKNLQVGYTLNKSVHKLNYLGDVRIYFSGQDLWEKTGMWFNYYDPENTDRVSFGYPLWRSYAIGLNIGF